MYQNIRAHETPRELYRALLAQGRARCRTTRRRWSTATISATARRHRGHHRTRPTDPDVDWSKEPFRRLSRTLTDTTVAREKLLTRWPRINAIPADIVLHPRVAKIYEDRRKMAAGEVPGDWGFAENLAYATLLDAGFRLRLVGQDCEPRHLLPPPRGPARPERTRTDHVRCASLGEEPNPEDATIIDSLLSEEAVMAFEYGYSTADPTLDIWEAQFGDFANGAQVVIDQFLVPGEAKWGRLCGLSLFPHGYEGQGPRAQLGARWSASCSCARWRT